MVLLGGSTHYITVAAASVGR